DTEIATDATTVQTVHYEFWASNAAVAREMAQQAIPFSEHLETLEIVEATTLKADGRRLPVDLAKVVTSSNLVSRTGRSTAISSAWWSSIQMSARATAFRLLGGDTCITH